MNPRLEAAAERVEQRAECGGTARNKLRLLSTADCQKSERRQYIVKGMIAAGDLAIIFAPPGVGKSAVAPLIAYAVSQGQPIFGRRVKQGKVLYAAAEDAHGMRSRVVALLNRHGEAPLFSLVDGVTDLLSPEGQADELVALVDEHRPILVVIDTIAASFPGLLENESVGMGQVVRVARSLAHGADDKPGPAVILLHHTPKADDTSMRGHGSLNGDADVTIRLSKDPDTGIVTANFGKNRNGPSDGIKFAFSVEAETIGEDEDGDEITAPVAVECRTPAAGRSKLKPTEHTAKQFLADLLAEQGKPLPYGAGFAIELNGVNETVWREACDNRRLSTCEDKKERSKVFKRAYAGLRDKGMIGTNAGWVWLTHPGRGIGDHP